MEKLNKKDLIQCNGGGVFMTAAIITVKKTSPVIIAGIKKAAGAVKKGTEWAGKGACLEAGRRAVSQD